MSKLAWGVAGSRLYETGVDRGVLYVAGESGVPWNGLISVTESPTGGEPQPYYADGFKYANISTAEEFEATIEAYTAPPEFAKCEGLGTIHTGLFIGQQPRKPFSLVYRTRIGNDLDPEYGYKIHIIYNALTGPSERVNTTLNDSPEAMTKSWEISTTPPNIAGYRPSSHIVIDSRLSDPVMLGYLEGVLYGAENMEPRIISANEIISLFSWQASGRTAPIYLVGNAATDSEFVENLNTNPSFETSNGTVDVWKNMESNPSFEYPESAYEMWRNLATNPGLELQGTAVETRRNLAHNSRAAINVQAGAAQVGWRETRWFGGGGGGGYHEWITTGTGPIGSGITSYLRKIWTASPNGNGDTGFDHTQSGTSSLAVTPGKTYSVSVYLRASAAGKTGAGIRMYFYDAAGQSVGGTVVGPTSNLEAGVWSRLQLTTTAPVGSAFVRIVSDANSGTVWLPGDSLDGTGLLVEEASKINFYFDGSTPASGDFTYAWLGGTANGNGSIQQGVAVSAFHSNNGAQLIQSIARSHSGVRSGRLLMKTAPELSMAATHHAVGLTAGKTYTVMAYMYVPSSSISSAPSVRVSGFTQVDPITVADTWKLSRITFVASATTHPVYLPINTKPSLEGQELWIDSVMIVESEYAGAYFDGGTVDTADFTYEWTGAVNASASTMMALTPLGWGYNRGVRKMWQSSDWAATPGGKSVAIIGGAPNFDTFAEGRIVSITGDLAGRTFTVLATRRTTENLPALRDARAWRTNWTYHKTGGGTGNVLGTVGPETAGVHQVRDIFTFPAEAGPTAFFRLYNGSSTTGSVVYWDDLLVVEGAYYGPYFDGDTPDTDEFNHAWVGTTNGSVSLQTGKTMSGFSLNSPSTTAAMYQGTSGALSGTNTAQLLMKTSSGTGVIIAIPDRPAATPGMVFTAFGSVKQDAGSYAGRFAQPYIYFYGSDDALLNFYAGEKVYMTGGYVEMKVTATAPTGTVKVGAALNVYSSLPGDLYTFDSFLLTNDDYSTDDPYFDGDTTDIVIYNRQQVFPQWAGTPHASRSEFSFYPALDREARPNDAMLVGTEMWIYNEQGYWEYHSQVPGLTV